MRFHLMLACFLAFAPLVAAEGNESTGSASPEEQPQESGNAWVEDCPPDMMCAYDEQSNATCDPACEYGEPGCIECSGPVEDPETCMDGSAADCDPDVQYLDGGASPETTSRDDAPADTKTVPAAAAVGVLGTLGLAVLLARRAVR